MCQTVTRKLAHRLEDLLTLWKELEPIVEGCGLPTPRVRLPFEEAFVNAIKHGKELPVEVHYSFGPNCFALRVKDQGAGFNPDALPDPLAPENLERPGGRGIFLIRQYARQAIYMPPGNCVIMLFGNATVQCLRHTQLCSV